MSIINLQRRIAEVGRLRLGEQIQSSNGKSRPAKLETWRVTSPDQQRIINIANLYGGKPREWQAPSGRQYEVITETDSLPVIVPPSDMCFSQHMELWSAGGCQRRCDGQTESISDQACVCDPDNPECSVHTRLSVMLRDVVGLGVWRVDTQGWHAAHELQGAVEVIRMAASTGQMLPATLRLEQRMVKREGQTRRFAVPVLDIEVSPAQLLAGGRSFDTLDAGTVAIEAPVAVPTRQEVGLGGGDTLERSLSRGAERARVWEQDGPLTPVPQSVPERPTATIAEQATKTKERKPRKGAAQPIPATGLAPRTVAEAVQAALPVADARAAADELVAETEHLGLYNEPPPPDEPELIRPALLKKLVILLREQGFGDDDRQARLDYCAAAIGRAITSSKDLTVGEATKIIDTLEMGEE